MSFARAAWLVLALFFWQGEAGAHATLLSSAPADAAALAQAPAEVVLRFDEPVAPISMRLIDGNGAAVTPGGPVRAEGDSVRLPLPKDLGQGAYLLSYRVVSADSHPVTGTIAFTVGQATQPVRPVVADEAVSPLGPGGIWVRGLRDISLLVALGGALFVAWVGGFPGQRATLVAAAVAGALLALLGALMQTAALMGLPVALSVPLVAMAIKSSTGFSALFTVAAMALVAAGAWLGESRLRSAVLTLGALLVPVSLVLTGHAASAQPTWLAATAMAAHVLAAGFWAGSLVALFLLLRQDDPRSRAGLLRFSAVAVAMVGVLLAGGAGFAAMQLGSLEALAGGRYGQLVLLKLGLLLALLALAAGNRYRLVPRFERAEPKAQSGLKRAVAAEMLLVLGVVSATAVLSQTPPHEALASGAIRLELTGSSTHTGTLAVSPGVPGHNEFVVQLRDAQGQPVDPEETTMLLSNPAAGMEAMERKLTRTAPGTFRYEGHETAFAGSWQVEVRARLNDFDRVELQATLPLR